MTTQAERHVADAVRLLSSTLSRLPKALKHLALLTPDGWPGGSTSDPVTGGGEHEPTANAAIAGLVTRELHGRITSLAAEVRGIASELDDAIGRVPDVAVDTQSDAAKLRCSGGEGDWADATCTRLMVTTVESELQRGTRIPVCDTCRKRRQRHQWRLEGRYDPTTGGPVRTIEEETTNA